MIFHCFSDAREYPVIGMDCQWVPVTLGKKRRPVALLQLASHKGNVALIQLSESERLPYELLSLLSNKNIIKVGIESEKDAEFLYVDHQIKVNSTFDLRHLAADVKVFPGSLQRLAKEVLSRELSREKDYLNSDWEEPKLNLQLIIYATSSVKCSIDIFKTLIVKKLLNASKARILAYCQAFLGQRFRYDSGKDYLN